MAIGKVDLTGADIEDATFFDVPGNEPASTVIVDKNGRASVVLDGDRFRDIKLLNYVPSGNPSPESVSVGSGGVTASAVEAARREDLAQKLRDLADSLDSGLSLREVLFFSSALKYEEYKKRAFSWVRDAVPVKSWTENGVMHISVGRPRPEGEPAPDARLTLKKASLAVVAGVSWIGVSLSRVVGGLLSRLWSKIVPGKDGKFMSAIRGVFGDFKEGFARGSERYQSWKNEREEAARALEIAKIDEAAARKAKSDALDAIHRANFRDPNQDPLEAARAAMVAAHRAADELKRNVGTNVKVSKNDARAEKALKAAPSASLKKGMPFVAIIVSFTSGIKAVFSKDSKLRDVAGPMARKVKAFAHFFNPDPSSPRPAKYRRGAVSG